MSLFPAYKSKKTDSNDDVKDATSWLNNPSFTTNISNIQPRFSSECSSDTSDLQIINEKDSDVKSKRKREDDSCSSSSKSKDKIYKRRHKSKKRKHKAKSKREKRDTQENSSYIFDKEGNLNLLKKSDIPKSERPKYHWPCKSLDGVYAAKLSLKKKKKIIRYFSKKVVNSGQDDDAVSQELTKLVESLNKAVHEQPNVVNNWLELINFQDDYFKFQPIRYKSEGERIRATGMQKIAILERAMSSNRGDEVLQKKWLTLASDYCTYDELISKLDTLLKDEPESLLLHLGRIMLIQSSMPRCNLKSVFNSYKWSIETIHKCKRLSSAHQDDLYIELLLYTCSFLNQSGLWEIMWFTLKSVLDLNLNLDIPTVEDSDQIILDEENRILEISSSMPVWHLWSKLENLRQGCHFLPASKSINFPQRVVAADDVADLIFHTHRNSHLRLLFILPFLCKVPFLPRSHSLISVLSPQLPSWVFDGIENHLAATLSPSPLLLLKSKHLSNHLPNDCTPQYFRRIPGQQLLLSFISKTFDMAKSALTGSSKILFGVWYLRFLRWLDHLQRLGRFEPPTNRPKTKNIFKEFLKREDNRDVILFYIEYALWQFEAGDIKDAVNTLQTVIDSKGGVLTESDELKKCHMCHLYRMLCETQIAGGFLENAKETLIKLSGASNENTAGIKLKHVALEAIHSESCEETLEGVLPSFSVDWAVCYALYLMLMNQKEEGLSFLKECINSSKTFLKEKFYEAHILLTRCSATDGAKVNLKVVHEAIKEFPLNGLFSYVIAEHLIQEGGLWWKDSHYLINNMSSMTCVAFACVALERNKQKDGEDSNRCLSILKQLVREDGKHSGVLHRMYLKFLHDSGDLTAVEEARVLALESCPWNKALYMDAITLCPAHLMSITDLMVEKDLRIHITPDEIDAMRD